MAAAEAEASDGWYIQARGRVLGPLTWSQLRALRDRGQLARFHAVSRDRHHWVSAASLHQLFPKAEGGGSAGTADPPAHPVEFIVLDEAESTSPRSNPTAPAEYEGPAWFFARDGGQHGPLPLCELQGLAAAGEISPETLVWRNGMEDWTPGLLIPELAFPPPATAVATPTIGPRLTTAPGNLVPFQADPAPRTCPMAFASMVLGLLWLCGIGSLGAIILGVVALRQIARSQGTLTGKSLAIVGLLLGFVGLAICTLAFFWFSANEHRRP
jgi:hypothetical protein